MTNCNSQEPFVYSSCYCVKVECDMKEVTGRVFTQDSSKPTTIQSLSDKLGQARLFLADSMTAMSMMPQRQRTGNILWRYLAVKS